jgi:hypothetical protein
LGQLAQRLGAVQLVDDDTVKDQRRKPRKQAAKIEELD